MLQHTNDVGLLHPSGGQQEQPQESQRRTRADLKTNPSTLGSYTTGLFQSELLRKGHQMFKK